MKTHIIYSLNWFLLKNYCFSPWNVNKTIPEAKSCTFFKIKFKLFVFLIPMIDEIVPKMHVIKAEFTSAPRIIFDIVSSNLKNANNSRQYYYLSEPSIQNSRKLMSSISTYLIGYGKTVSKCSPKLDNEPITISIIML